MQKSCLLFMMIILALPAFAAAERRIELTPLAGYGIGGSFEEQTTTNSYPTNELELDEAGVFGIAVDWGIMYKIQYELFFSHQQTRLTQSRGYTTLPSSLFDIDVSYLHIGGTVGFGDYRIDPFIVGTVGVTHFNPKHASYSSKNHFSIGVGGGVKFFITNNIGFRVEARGLGTLINGGGWFRSDAEGAQIGVEGDTFWQAQFNAGLIMKF